VATDARKDLLKAEELFHSEAEDLDKQLSAAIEAHAELKQERKQERKGRPAAPVVNADAPQYALACLLALAMTLRPAVASCGSRTSLRSCCTRL